MQRLPVRFKFLIWFLVFGSWLLVLSGCANKEGAAKKTITVWHWMTDREPAFKELSARYEAETGIKVNFELYAPSDAYSQKVRAAAQGVNLPDIFGILATKKDFASFIKAGYILNLTPYMQADNNIWENAFFSKALAVNEFGQDNSYGVPCGIYGVPIDIMTIQMVYNKNLLKKLKLNSGKPPSTFQELISMGKKIKDAQLEGLVSGWGEVWMIDCFANNYAFNIMGEDKVIATIKGEIPYTDPDWIKVLGLFKEMRDCGILSSSIIAMVNKSAEQLFATEKAVFAFNGSWCVNVYQDMNPELDYGVMLPPKASENFALNIWGGAGSSFMVNAESPKKEEAVKFLKWLTSVSQQAYLSEATNNLPANKECLSKIPKILAQFAQGMEYATHPNVWGVSEFPQVIEAWDKGIQLIIIGEKTPEQVALEVQKIKERELAKKR
ncbi:MAG: extracellular solute-binding protein [Candidatus Omnitrophota bacterium]|nr:extracellular solute-binding protein [Candidatus Omnitrophota bacterium]